MLRRTALARTALARTALAVTAAAVAVSGAALLVPHPADAATQLVASADSPQQKLLTDAQRRQLRTTGHVTVTRATKHRGTVTVLVQRGKVDAVTPTSITLTSKDGYHHTYAITPQTKVRERRQPVDLGDLKVGERAMVVALHTGAGDTARRISCLRA